MTNEHLESLLDDAYRIEATDLYPTQCRTVVNKLASALRGAISDLEESRNYGLALEREMKDRAEQTVQFVEMAASMDEDFKAALDAICRALSPIIVREAEDDYENRLAKIKETAMREMARLGQEFDAAPGVDQVKKEVG